MCLALVGNILFCGTRIYDHEVQGLAASRERPQGHGHGGLLDSKQRALHLQRRQIDYEVEPSRRHAWQSVRPGRLRHGHELVSQQWAADVRFFCSSVHGRFRPNDIEDGNGAKED